MPPLWSGGRDSFGLGIDCFPGSSVLGATPSISIFNSVDRSSFGISNYLEDEDSISRWLPVWLGGLLTQSYIFLYILYNLNLYILLYIYIYYLKIILIYYFIFIYRLQTKHRGFGVPQRAAQGQLRIYNVI